MNTTPLLTWSENDAPRSALWRSDQVLPKQVVLADDTMTADTAIRCARQFGIAVDFWLTRQAAWDAFQAWQQQAREERATLFPFL